MTNSFMTREEFREQAQRCLPSDVAEEVERLAMRDCIALVPDPEGVDGFLGGFVPVSIRESATGWPECNHRALTHLGTIDLARLANLEPRKVGVELPSSGTLSFFWDSSNMVWGDGPDERRCGQVVYRAEDRLQLDRERPPISIPFLLDDTPVTARISLTFEWAVLLDEAPELVRRHHQALSELSDWFTAGAERRAYHGFGEVRIGGYPFMMQDTHCEHIRANLSTEERIQWDTSSSARDALRLARSRDWTSLAVFPDWGDPNSCWGGGGIVYFTILHSDLAKQDFKNVVAYMED